MKSNESIGHQSIQALIVWKLLKMEKSSNLQIFSFPDKKIKNGKVFQKIEQPILYEVFLTKVTSLCTDGQNMKNT